MADPPRRYLLDLHLAYHLAGALIEQELAGVGITAEEYAVYSVLSHHPSTTPTELSRRLGLALSSAIFRSRKLIERDHARRISNPRDGRSALIELTPEGRRVLERARPAFERVLDRIERHLQPPAADIHTAVLKLGEAVSAALAEMEDEARLERRAS